MNYAIITGASSGIGKELAKQFAENKTNLILIARNTKKLEEIKTQIQKQHKIQIEIISQDLSQENASQKIQEKTTKLQEKNPKLKIKYLVNNAGFGDYEEFIKTNKEKNSQMIQVNITSLVELTQIYTQEMIQKKIQGKILNIASTAAFQPCPNIAVYGATKSFVLNFSEAINQELKKHNISITCLCPGPTETNFGKDSKMENSSTFKNTNLMSAKQVAQIGYKAMQEKQMTKIAGFLNYLTTKIIGLIPSRKIIAKMSYESLKK